MRLKETIEAYRRNDPAARSGWEVFWLYNGLHATMYYRVAHWLYEHRLRFLGRWVSQFARRRTGIEIHPAAKIGRRLVIDHGTGIVIGATTEIGDDCLLYQNVTLGGTGMTNGKRHPTLGNNVMVGSGAKVLGPFKVGECPHCGELRRTARGAAGFHRRRRARPRCPAQRRKARSYPHARPCPAGAGRPVCAYRKIRGKIEGGSRCISIIP